MVEQALSLTKAILVRPPVGHKCDETIPGHVFCSFLALSYQGGLRQTSGAVAIKAEWTDVHQDLYKLTETEIEQLCKRFFVRIATREGIAANLDCAGARLVEPVRQVATDGQAKAQATSRFLDRY